MVISIFFIALLTCFFIFKKENTIINLLIFASLILIASLRLPYSTKDTSNYIYAFNSISDFSTFIRFEPTFVLITLVTKFMSFSWNFLFFVYASIAISIKFISIKKISNFYFVSIFVYISNFYILHELTQIRVGIATAILLSSIKPLYDRKAINFLIHITIAVLFHYSAFVFYILWFLNPFKLNKYSLISILFFSYILVLNNITLTFLLKEVKISQFVKLFDFYSSKNLSRQTNVVNIFNAFFIIRFFLCIYLICNYEYLSKINKYFILLIKIYVIGLTLFLLFSDFTIVSFRISELFLIVEIILFPLLIFLFRPQLISKFIPILISFIYLFLNIFYLKLIF
jgi:hypothetical protein